MLEEMEGKKVAVIGHFPGMEVGRRACGLTVLERNPQEGDLPDFAAEYVLPEQDYVFITGTALTNKTMPRLLELSEHATVGLVGADGSARCRGGSSTGSTSLPAPS